MKTEFGRLITGCRQDVDLVDAASAFQIADETPDTCVRYAGHARQNDRQVQPKAIYIFGCHGAFQAEQEAKKRSSGDGVVVQCAGEIVRRRP
jgi:hypothetical protein